MRRPMRWYWAGLWGLLTLYASGALTLYLCFGLPFGYSGVLEPALRLFVGALEQVTGNALAVWVTILLVSTPALLLSMLVFSRLRAKRAADNGYLHCLKCGYILKGLSEPRCPECGERI